MLLTSACVLFLAAQATAQYGFTFDVPQNKHTEVTLKIPFALDADASDPTACPENGTTSLCYTLAEGRAVDMATKAPVTDLKRIVLTGPVGRTSSAPSASIDVAYGNETAQARGKITLVADKNVAVFGYPLTFAVMAGKTYKASSTKVQVIPENDKCNDTLICVKFTPGQTEVNVSTPVEQEALKMIVIENGDKSVAAEITVTHTGEDNVRNIATGTLSGNFTGALTNQAVNLTEPLADVVYTGYALIEYTELPVKVRRCSTGDLCIKNQIANYVQVNGTFDADRQMRFISPTGDYLEATLKPVKCEAPFAIHQSVALCLGAMFVKCVAL